MNTFLARAIERHAQEEFPNECCGFVYVSLDGGCGVYKCQNKSLDKRNEFIIDPTDVSKANKLGHIVYLYHSHCDESENPNLDVFSPQDKIMSEELCVPFVLFSLPNKKWSYYEPKEIDDLPILERPFIEGIYDCYTTFRDYYKQHGIVLGRYFDFYIDNSIRDNPFIEERTEKDGFYEIDIKDLKPLDGITFKIRSKFVNHIAVYLGENNILHHKYNCISTQDELNEKFFKFIYKVYRHKNVL